MFKEKILSVIITSYNLEDLILDCIKSLNFFFNKKKYEIIIVDDNSKDKSVSIIKEFIFLKKINNIKVIQNLKNYGASKSRNIGLKNSKGEWLWFVDGDDKVCNLEKITNINWNKISAKIIHFKNKTTDFLSKQTNDKYLINKNNFLYSAKNFREIPLDFSPWNKFFHHSIFSNFLWPDVVAEDLFFVVRCFMNENILFINEFFYEYTINRNESFLNRLRKYNNAQKEISKIVAFIQQHKDQKNYQISGLFFLTTQLHFLNKYQMLFFKKLFKKHFKEIQYKWFFQRNFVFKISYSILRLRMFKLFKVIKKFSKNNQR